MYIRLSVLLLGSTLLGFVGIAPVHAQFPSADMYLSPGFMLPSGAINITPNRSSSGLGGASGGVIPNGFTSETAPVGDTTNYLGCAGVGQGEFTSGLYNMPESFSKFQEDVNSNLARELLAMNFVLPQTAAMFDQLNTFGNQRYQQFQQGCSLDALKQDAKQQYVKACVERVQPGRRSMILTGGASSSTTATAPNNTGMSEDKVNAMAYAQSWEICSNQYISDTIALSERRQGLDAFARKTREVEDVRLAIRPLLCPAVSGTTAPSGSPSSATAGENGCWAMFLVPQAKLCLGADLQNGCEAEYGVKEPIVSMRRLYDSMRYALEQEVLTRRVKPLNKTLWDSDFDTAGAAREAVIAMSTIAVSNSTNASTVSALPNLPLRSVQDFQLNFLSCKDYNVLQPVEQYAGKIRQLMRGAPVSGTVSVTAITKADYDQVVTLMDLGNTGRSGSLLGSLDPSGNAEDIQSMGALLQSAIGCTANQSVPMFDPKLMSSMIKCSADDREIFYTMAANDVALAATRDVYRYLNLRLKQVYTQLLTNNLVPSSSSSTTGSVSPTYSAEINGRLANVVKSVMIPFVDSQIERINELNNVRGDFANRTRQIYQAGTGCIGAIGTGGGGGW